MISFEKFVKNGNLTSSAANGLGISGVAIVWGAAYLFDDWSGVWFWMFMCVGATVGYFGAYSGLARKFGFSPFTNDPLGWRKAKESYKTPKGLSDKTSGDK